MSEVESCAEEADGKTKKAAELSKSVHFCNLVGISIPL
jgi:hypothetical protein